MKRKVFGKSCKLWSDTEDQRIAFLYPTKPKAEVLYALRGRTWETVQARASKLGVVRLRLDRTKRIGSRLKPRSALFKDLIEARVKARITQEQLGDIIGVSGQSAVANMEAGSRGVSVPILIAWCQSLGLELRANQVSEPRKPMQKLKKMGLKEQAIMDMDAYNARRAV
jgi:transcriptional regulator with XRE-family HTH domain